MPLPRKAWACPDVDICPSPRGGLLAEGGRGGPWAGPLQPAAHPLPLSLQRDPEAPGPFLSLTGPSWSLGLHSCGSFSRKQASSETPLPSLRAPPPPPWPLASRSPSITVNTKPETLQVGHLCPGHCRVPTVPPHRSSTTFL